ncbi:hypothetical protein KC331_g11000 [Hortaea werneckii]|uniref:5-formyltetrahydrofolate cyclo-ligase n=1 Tax=Hortaea werneckii TaxID=91943 RepID=A0A3M7AW32_HORWE|nr:hypothetical protein KC331_g11000 [Hortaea werneckii]KAI7712941.1 hypothetical protein KC353_g7901 [Hortaea werneckii]RMY31745.1 hypothetical protein D0865_14917 [Hortaea werneckii]
MSSPSFSPSPSQTQNKSSLRTHLRKHILPSLPEEQISSQSHRAQTTILQDLPAWQKAERVSIYLSMPSGEARTEGLVRKALEAGKDVFVPVLCREREEGVGEGIDGSGEGRKQEGSSGRSGSGSGSGGNDGVSTAKLDQEQSKPKKKKRKMRMEMLKLDSLEEFELLERDSWGIPSLSPPSLAGRENARGGFGPEGWLSRPGNEEGDEGKGKGENGNEVIGKNGGGLDLIVVPGVAFDREMARMGHGAGFYDGYLTRLVTEGRYKKPFLVGLCLAEQVLEPGRILMEDWDWRVDAVATGDGRLLTRDGGA